MARRKPFKKNLTPIGRRGRIDTLTGKGATEQRMMPGQRESLTGDPFGGMTNTYPARPQPPPTAPGGTIGPQPTALMPGGLGRGVPDEEL
jgi:hypothetical protein